MVELEKEPSLSTYVIEYSMETKAKHRVDVVRMVALLEYETRAQ